MIRKKHSHQCKVLFQWGTCSGDHRDLHTAYRRQRQMCIRDSYEGYPQNAEKVNGRWAMIGFVALLGAYITTGQIIPGIF